MEVKAIWILRIAGTAIVVLNVLMLAVFPSKPVRENVPGFINPVIGFELASSPAHVFGILGEPNAPERAEAVRKMDLGNRIDFLYMISYAALYAGIALLLAARGNMPNAVATVLLALAALMWAGDLLENRELLYLSGTVEPSAMTDSLGRLRGFTTLKWHAIFGASAIAAFFLWREPDWWRWSAIFFAGGAIVGFASVAHLPAIEWSTVFIAIAWAMTWIHAIRDLGGGKHGVRNSLRDGDSSTLDEEERVQRLSRGPGAD